MSHNLRCSEAIPLESRYRHPLMNSFKDQHVSSNCFKTNINFDPWALYAYIHSMPLCRLVIKELGLEEKPGGNSKKPKKGKGKKPDASSGKNPASTSRKSKSKGAPSKKAKPSKKNKSKPAPSADDQQSQPAAGSRSKKLRKS